MHHSERSELTAIITDALAFYRRDVSAFALSVWWQACQNFDLEQVVKALTAHAMDPEQGRFPPMPADIVKHLNGTHTDRALVAWGKVYEAIQRVGAYESVVFDDPAIHAAVDDIGGWVAICRGDVDDLPHLQRRFAESHRVYSRRPGHAYPCKLLGAHEIENKAGGYAPPMPVLIGNPNAARAVFEAGTSASRVAITTARDALRLPDRTT